eukprot:CAMPEP_0171593564 /NCGR_PEP_ID=MMETSP0990-20121206/188_1 /TAXON_ID=483369 /ORGANISM="non described non described, Strain CCMP2098" /LENGTH=104 /DNA_ID=CAMNT_0012154125 /DNA_START=395 /DNA_END=709 /DNA_ORIENTATION=-
MARPTKSSGSRVAATPSESSLADTIRLSPAHHRPAPLSALGGDDCSRPSGVRFASVTSISYGKVDVVNPLFSGKRAERTGGALPRVPERIAAGTLSGLSGRAVK